MLILIAIHILKIAKTTTKFGTCSDIRMSSKTCGKFAVELSTAAIPAVSRCDLAAHRNSMMRMRPPGCVERHSWRQGRLDARRQGWPAPAWPVGKPIVNAQPEPPRAERSQKPPIFRKKPQPE